jgi:transposase
MNALPHVGILPQFSGISIHDGWASYLLHDCQQGVCIVHPLRELVFLAEEQAAVWASDLKEGLLEMKQTTDQVREHGTTRHLHIFMLLEMIYILVS